MGDKVSLRGRQLRWFFVKHVRNGSVNLWSFTTDDPYYIIVFYPLSRATIFEHYDDPDWTDNYQDMINVRTKWRGAMRAKHGAFPRDSKEQILRKDTHSLPGPSPTPVIDKDISVYFQPQTPSEKESLYLRRRHTLYHTIAARATRCRHLLRWLTSHLHIQGFCN
ncbi:uncharacterized protein FTJAE_5019 [Fusarium tjaetaba]|uniref:Uncharacterized protein n=1 Tax=Fusarium tjaetaba TaxID=1567544 RepID=A0A8H5RTR2_9HYPO|nr:uncharacterized protein FTJAE_5019 [Fusarium tjaetaba]KAF5638948.1 hypothetical protein FTJAE_5019 [Fusarium tjaetaba]